MRMLPWLVSVAMFFSAADARADVTRIEVRSRGDALGGQSLGPAGPYEIVEATVHFSVDPHDPHNRAIVDVDKAPRNAAGRVEFSADLYVVKPRDPARGNGVLVFEVPNRGNHAAVEESDYLMQRGFTIVALGWQFDVVPRPGILRLHAPVATEGGASIEGLVRYWFRPDEKTPTVSLDEPARGTVPYAVLDPANRAHTLTVRLRELDEPRPIPREKWQFATVRDGKVVPDATSVYLADGFEPGLLYEVVYRARNPGVAGLGFAAVRDAISHFRYGQTLLGPIRYAYAYGVSQSGRFLRGLVYEGFNTDVQDRAVFDGVFDLVAGGVRSGFNARFAQPSIVEPARFPFSDSEQRNPHTGVSDALLARATKSGTAPKVIHLNTSNEYWAHGIVDVLPPRRGAAYPVLVPRVDADGNEPCCLRLPEHAVPLATYTGWNLRHPRIGAPTELARLQGGYIPFPRTKADRAKSADPRASIEERYAGVDEYVGRVSAVAQELLGEGYLLAEDVPAIAARAREHWGYAMGSGR